MKKCRNIHWAVAWLCLACLAGQVLTESVEEDHHGTANESTINGTDGSGEHSEGEEEIHRYKVATVDFQRVVTPYVISAWIILASIAKLLFHFNNRLSAIFPESCLLILLGVILGIILYFTNVRGYEMDTSVFFFYLLPPIILDAGYFMPNRAFFDNIGTILLYAVIGTLFNCLLIGFSVYGLSETTGVGWIGIKLDMLQCLVFAALLSAVDPVAVLAVFEQIHVNEVLHIVVFGESLLNDAVTVVLYHMFEAYSEIGQSNIIAVDIILGLVSFALVVVVSTLIGIVFGFVTSYMTRFTDHVRVIEPLIVLVMGYLSYLTAEIFHLSGILACTFCGITMRKYVEKNISSKSRTTIKYFLKMLASTCETIIFMLLGISTVVDTHHWDTAFVLLTLLFCLVYRTIGVLILTFLANRVRLARLSKVDQFVMAYGGLRGAIAFSLVVLLDEHHFPQRNLFITTTVVVVYFTVFVQGTTIKPLVNFLKVKKAEKRKPTMNEQINNRLIDHFMAGIEDISGHHGHHELRQKWEYLDNRYLKPFIIKQKGMQHRGQSIVNVFNKLNEKDASDYIRRRGSFVMPSSSDSQAHLPSTGSFAQLYTSYTGGHRNSEGSIGNENRNGGGGGGGGGVPMDDPMGPRLDLKVLETEQPGRKIRSDSFFHHLMDDALFKTRQKFVAHDRHMVRDQSVPDIYQHKDRLRLRKLISAVKKHQLNSRHHDDDYDPGGERMSSPRKSVSFGDIRDDDGTKDTKMWASDGSAATTSESESEDEGVTFTVGNLDVIKAPVEPTAAEATLPWKRNTGREPVSSVVSHSIPDEDAVQRGEEPSWAKNVEYKGVPDPNVSKVSPVTASPPQDIFKLEVEDKKSKSSSSDESDPPTEPLSSSLPWRQEEEVKEDKVSPATEQEASMVTAKLPWREDTDDGISTPDVLPKLLEDKDLTPESSEEVTPTESLPWRRDERVPEIEASIEVPLSDASPKLPWQQEDGNKVDQGYTVTEEVPASTLPWRREEEETPKLEDLVLEEIPKQTTTTLPWRQDDAIAEPNPNPKENPAVVVEVPTSVAETSLPWRQDDSTVEANAKPNPSVVVNVPTSVAATKTNPNPNSAVIVQAPVAAVTSLPWRQKSSDDEAPVPSPSVNGAAVIEAELPSSHSFRLSEAESRHSEHVHHMVPMIDPEAEPRETPVNGDLPVMDDDADSADSSLRVQQWLEESDGTEQDPDLDDDFPVTLELRTKGHAPGQGQGHSSDDDNNDIANNTSSC